MIYLFLLCLFNALQSFFGGIECSFVSIQIPRVRNGVRNGCKRAAIIFDKMDNVQLVLSSTLVGTNISIVFASLMAVRFIQDFLGFQGRYVGILTTVGMTFLILIFDIVPKNWARQAPYRRLLVLIYPYCFFAWLLYIPGKLMCNFANWFVNLVSKSNSNSSQLFLRNDFRFLLRDSEAANIMSKNEVATLDNAIDFFKFEAKDILIPSSKVVTIKAMCSVADALKLCREKEYSRLVVIDDTGLYIGVFSLYEVMDIVETAYIQTLLVKDVMRHATTIKSKLKIHQIIGAARENNSPLLFVENSRGKILGVVTAEDVIKSVFCN
ncbi:CNNM domain-containing protein [Lentisphaerota bacterium WC36G]|nr:CNNM domain-containing protein [Lentisphaerae bacterium WC36]